MKSQIKRYKQGSIRREDFLAKLEERGVLVSTRTIQYWEMRGWTMSGVRRWEHGKPGVFYPPQAIDDVIKFAEDHTRLISECCACCGHITKRTVECGPSRRAHKQHVRT